MTTNFTVSGPLEVPCYRGKAGRTITPEDIQRFWRSHPGLAKRQGCYVFGIRAGRGFTPGYVGKATKSFQQEVFAPHKLAKYQQFLADYLKGTPILFFLIAPSKKGKVNSKHIEGLEDFLIQKAVAANPQLLNVKGTQQEEWAIQGIIRSSQGKPSMAAREFKKIMKST
jgi:hypothetical protein